MKKTKNPGRFKMPNAIIKDIQLTYAAKRVAATIYASCNAQGHSSLGLARLARFAGCAASTAAQSVRQLEERGYLSVCRSYRWSRTENRMVYSCFTIACQPICRDFTLIPRAVLRVGLHKGAFAVYLYLRMVSGNTGRAFPSLNHIAQGLGMSKATVCRAIAEQVRAGLVHLEHCKKQDQAYSCNSYFFVRQEEKAPSTEKGIGASPRIRFHPVRKVRLTTPFSTFHYTFRAPRLQAFFQRGGSLIFSKLE